MNATLRAKVRVRFVWGPGYHYRRRSSLFLFTVSIINAVALSIPQSYHTTVRVDILLIVLVVLQVVLSFLSPLSCDTIELKDARDSASETNDREKMIEVS